MKEIVKADSGWSFEKWRKIDQKKIDSLDLMVIILLKGKFRQ